MTYLFDITNKNLFYFIHCLINQSINQKSFHIVQNFYYSKTITFSIENTFFSTQNVNQILFILNVLLLKKIEIRDKYFVLSYLAQVFRFIYRKWKLMSYEFRSDDIHYDQKSLLFCNNLNAEWI